MSQSSLSPDERIDNAVSVIRAKTPDRESSQIVASMQLRATRATRLRLASGLAVAATAATSIGFALFPRSVMADLPLVVKKTRAQELYLFKSHVWNLLENRYEFESDTVVWRGPDGAVVKKQDRKVDHVLEPGFPVGQAAVDQSTAWMLRSGKVIESNSRFPRAIEYQKKPVVDFPDIYSLDELEKQGQVVEKSEGVSAHGGVYDKYLLTFSNSNSKTFVYVDHGTHLIRFIDVPKNHRHPESLTRGSAQLTALDSWMQVSIEIEYLNASDLHRATPAVPSRENCITAAELKAKFEAEISKPVGTATVKGIKKTLYGLVVRAPGEVFAITTGGAPLSIGDSHCLEVENIASRPVRERATPMGPRVLARDGSEEVLHFERPYPIAGRNYLVESSHRDIVSDIPKTMTVKVPVWDYDRSRSYKCLDGSRAYASRFVGYATFTTDKIYALPERMGNGLNGAKLPSDF